MGRAESGEGCSPGRSSQQVRVYCLARRMWIFIFGDTFVHVCRAFCHDGVHVPEHAPREGGKVERRATCRLQGPHTGAVFFRGYP